MARQRTTFGKLQRAAEKRERAQAKQERRAAQAAQAAETASEPPPPDVDQSAVLEAFAELHTAYEEGRIPRDEFESKKALLSSQLIVD